MEYYENEEFSKLDISGSEYSDIRFTDCEFTDCTFSELKLKNVLFSGCGFARCHASSLEFKDSSFNDTRLFNCTIYGMNWGELMSAGAFSEPISEMSGCRLRGGIFERFDFRGNSLLECLFSECDLRESDFTACDLSKTEFLNCDLRKSDFRGASGYNPDIFSCKMKGAAFSSTDALSLLNALEIKID